VQHNPHENLEINVAITECPADQQVRIQITDTGQPIPELEIEPLLSGYDPDPLNHGEQIGLWEVQTIINAHRGALLVPENNVNQKTVEIILPRKENNELDKQ
jgi:signal transduction histidine kinase